MQNSWGSCVAWHTDLATPRLDHELSGKVRGRLGLQRADDDALVQRVTGHDLQPMEWAHVSVSADLPSTVYLHYVDSHDASGKNDGGWRWGGGGGGAGDGKGLWEMGRGEQIVRGDAVRGMMVLEGVTMELKTKAVSAAAEKMQSFLKFTRIQQPVLYHAPQSFLLIIQYLTAWEKPCQTPALWESIYQTASFYS